MPIRRKQLPLVIDRVSAVNVTAAHKNRILASNNITVTLPVTANNRVEDVVGVLNVDGTTITLSPNVGQTINGSAASIVLDTQFDYIEVYWSTGGNWIISVDGRQGLVATTLSLDPVISYSVTDPSLLTPVTGDRYLIPIGAVGVWAVNVNSVAEWNGSAWIYTVPVIDNTVYVTDTLTTYRFNGTIWVVYTGQNLTLTGTITARQIATVRQVIVVPAATASQNIDFINGSNIVLDLRNTTINLTITFSNPTDAAEYTITVIDHAATPRTITFPTGTISVDGGGNTFTASLPNTRYSVELSYKSADPVLGAHYSFVPIPSYA